MTAEQRDVSCGSPHSEGSDGFVRARTAQISGALHPRSVGLYTPELISHHISRTILTAGESLRLWHRTKNNEKPKPQSTERNRTWDLFWEWLRRNLWKLHLFLQEH